jgi:hypothetical protein
MTLLTEESLLLKPMSNRLRRLLRLAPFLGEAEERGSMQGHSHSDIMQAVSKKSGKQSIYCLRAATGQSHSTSSISSVFTQSRSIMENTRPEGQKISSRLGMVALSSMGTVQ